MKTGDTARALNEWVEDFTAQPILFFCYFVFER